MTRSFDPSHLSPADCYKLLIGGIVPRPIAWVSTISPDGKPNLAPFSFFAGVGSNPMMVLFCPANTPEGTEKDTLRNAKLAIEGGVGEFVINAVPHALAAKMALTAEPLAYGESEFDLANLTPTSCLKVNAPRIAESPLAYECLTRQVIRTNPGAPSGGNIVIGEVVQVHMNEELVNERMHISPQQLDAVGRMGGTSYCTTRERFELPMGRGPARMG